MNYLDTKSLPQDERKMLIRTIWRTIWGVSQNYNYVRQMGHGCAWCMIPYIKWLYPNDKDKRTEAYAREAVFYNITPDINPIGVGLFSTMEKEYKENPDNFDPAIINNVKIAIMGPMSGIGDSLFQITIRLFITSIALPFAQAGSIMGAIIMTLGQFLFQWGASFVGAIYLYNAGREFVVKAINENFLPMLTRAASILGMVMVGAMIQKTCDIPFAIEFGFGDQVSTLSSLFDSIAPGLLGLGLTLLCYRLIRNKFNPNVLLLVFIVIGLVGAAIGIF